MGLLWQCPSKLLPMHFTSQLYMNIGGPHFRMPYWE